MPLASSKQEACSGTMKKQQTEGTCIPEVRATHRKLLFPRMYMDFRAGQLRVKICSLPPNPPSVHNVQSSGAAENKESSEYSKLLKTYISEQNK